MFLMPAVRIVIEPVDEIATALDADHAQRCERHLTYLLDCLVGDAPGTPQTVPAKDDRVICARDATVVIASHVAQRIGDPLEVAAPGQRTLLPHRGRVTYASGMITPAGLAS